MAGFPWNPFAVERVDMTTALSPEECIERLRDSVYVPWTIRGTRRDVPFGGTVKGNRFSLIKHVRFGGVGHYGNTFRVITTGSVRADSTGKTIISVRIAPHIVSRLFLFLPVVGSIGFLFAWLLHAFGLVRPDPNFPGPGVIMFFAVLFSAFAYAGYLLLSLLNVWITHDEGAYVVNTLSQILDAHTMPRQRETPAGTH
jgi:hypothetical protein